MGTRPREHQRRADDLLHLAEDTLLSSEDTELESLALPLARTAAAESSWPSWGWGRTVAARGEGQSTTAVGLEPARWRCGPAGPAGTDALGREGIGVGGAG